MLIRNIKAGNVYVFMGKDREEVVRCGRPYMITNVESGMGVDVWTPCGETMVVTRDGSLHPASMREQRDFWKDSFEALLEELGL